MYQFTTRAEGREVNTAAWSDSHNGLSRTNSLFYRTVASLLHFNTLSVSLYSFTCTFIDLSNFYKSFLPEEDKKICSVKSLKEVDIMGVFFFSFEVPRIDSSSLDHLLYEIYDIHRWIAGLVVLSAK